MNKLTSYKLQNAKISAKRMKLFIPLQQVIVEFDQT